MPIFAAAALPFTMPAIGAVADGTGAVLGAHESAGATEKSAQLQTDAANHAADIKAKSDAEALAFSKQQAENAYQNQEQARRQNYNLQAAQLARRGTLANLLGVATPTMPDYVPSQDPNFTGGTLAPQASSATTPTAGPTPSGQAPTGNLSDPKAWMALVSDKQALSQWVAQGLGPAAQKPGLVDYYVQKVQGQPGANPTEQAGSAQYWLQKLQSDPNVTGGAPAASAARPAPTTGTLGSMVQPYQVANPTPALQIQPYQGTLSRLGA